MRRTVVLHLLVITIFSAINNFRLLSHTREYIQYDSPSYIEPARSLASGHGFTRAVEASFKVISVPGYPLRSEPETFRTPLYPLLIAAIGPVRRVIIVQHLMNIAIALALYLFTLAVLDSPWIAFAAAILFLWFPPNAHFANQIMTETLFTALLFASIVAIYFAISRRSLPLAIVAGTLLGLTTLTRPIAVYFVIPLALVLLLQSRRIVIAFVLASLVLPLAWVARNKHVSGVATISTASAENALYQLAAPIVVTQGSSHLFRLTASQQQLGFRYELFHEQRRLFFEAMDLARADGVDPTSANAAQRAVYLQRLAMPIIRSHPIDLAELMISAIVEMHVMGPADVATEYGYDRLESERRFIPLALAAIALLVWGLWRLYWSNATLSLLIAVTIAYFTLTAAIPESGMKYALIFAPVYCLGLAYGGAELRRLATRGPS
jgi:hypothetical protein